MFVLSEIMLIYYLATGHKNQYGIMHSYYVDFTSSLARIEEDELFESSIVF
jgi:hypothetical protein